MHGQPHIRLTLHHSDTNCLSIGFLAQAHRYYWHDKRREEFAGMSILHAMDVINAHKILLGKPERNIAVEGVG